ncbi:MAG: hypothetical protein KDG55_21920 [Rhodocyclaceae bacterium]|nr:hypothetical protein [Rhodocyclaceae bacterium]
MSPLLPIEFCIAIAPGRIEITRRAYGLRRRVEAWRRADLTPSGGETSGWRFAVDALAEMVAREHAVRGRITVVLSSHWVRFQVIPWDGAIASPSEFELYARACFERVHGDVVADWELRVDPAAAGQGRMACAIDRELLHSLADVIGRSGSRLTGVQPYLMHAFNPLASLVGRKRFLFVLAEPGRATLAAADRGGWTSVTNCPVADEAPALQALVDRELQLMGDSAPTEVLIHAPRIAAQGLERPDHEGWQIVPAGGTSDYAMAWGTRAG